MNPRKRRLSVAVTAITSGLAPALIWAQTNTFMLVPGIPGGSLDAGHAGWIDVTSLRQAFPAEGNAQSACDIEIVKGLDIAGPLLWAAAATGKRFAEIVIDVIQSGEESRKLYEIRLNDVGITGIATANDAATIAETVGLAPVTMTLSYFPQNPDGSPGVPVTTQIPCG